MKSHIELETAIFVMKKVLNLSDVTIAHAMYKETDLTFQNIEIEQIMEHLPSNRYLVKALVDIGFSQVSVSRMLELKPPSVSYNYNVRTDEEYHSSVISRLERNAHDRLQKQNESNW